jgi:hypothetical protein
VVRPISGLPCEGIILLLCSVPVLCMIMYACVGMCVFCQCTSTPSSSVINIASAVIVAGSAATTGIASTANAVKSGAVNAACFSGLRRSFVTGMSCYVFIYISSVRFFSTPTSELAYYCCMLHAHFPLEDLPLASRSERYPPCISTLRLRCYYRRAQLCLTLQCTSKLPVGSIACALYWCLAMTR